jgi:predicted CopG family antitoxin
MFSGMNTKLTLTIEDVVIEKAKKYARQEGRSLSDLVENYLKAITSSTEIKEVELSPIVKSLRGSFKAPEDFDYKKELINSLSEKYLE